jgi:phosphatidylserine/phosphatidylglycerophosphate/cardiolipin synthase-like enzyme
VSEELIDNWFITQSRRGKLTAATRNNEATAYIHYVDYYAAVGDAIAAVGNGGVILMAGWGLDLETPVGSASPQEKIGDLLKRVAAGGTRVRVLVSGHVENPSAPVVSWLNQQPGCAAILDDRLRLFGCFHQKSVVVLSAQGLVAFLGGMDFGRDRLPSIATNGAPWHDVQVRLRGTAAADVYATLASRWESHAKNKYDRLPRALMSGGVPRGSGCGVQVVRTYGNPRTSMPLTVRRPENLRLSIADAIRRLTARSEFSFAPTGESSIHDLMVKAIRATRETIYVEDQYFVACKGMAGNEELLQALAETIARPTFKHMLVLTTGVGTVQGELHQTNRRRRELVNRIAARFPDRISVWAYKGGQSRCYWLHSKTWIFDDTMAVIGSANFNRRGLSHDGELGAGVVDLDRPRRGWVHELRTSLWLKHLPTPKRPVTKDQVVDFEPGRALWVDTPDTYLFRMDIAVGEKSQPDNLILCGQPESSSESRMQRFIRKCACENTPLSIVARDEENQWNFAIDPDGS